MPTRAVRITGLAPGYQDLSVTVSGTPLSRSLCGLALTAEAGAEPRLTLDVVVQDPATVEGHMTVDIPEPTRAALVALGWTPPPADGQE